MRNGNAEEYGHIVRQFQRPIYIYCSRLLGSDSEGEDAAQDIFVKAYQSIGRYKPTGSFSSWLYSIAYHHCLNLLRRRKLHLKLQSLLKREEQTPGPETIVDNRTLSPNIEAALGRLSASERSLLILNILEERTSQEIAAIVGKNPEAVKKRIGRAKRKLRTMLVEEREVGIWSAQQDTLMQTRS
ncbi:RNA polymerase sigma factor [Cohnella sp. AR92]|uniref:RNA polymerase sigma factor n=1 Tax=Cohnella sp. AR92 TaxID=648716 RepID=UPI001EDEFA1C|nr:sigma-70 family RNA polymerase sigma factor [Cohnella sp. AR92]